MNSKQNTTKKIWLAPTLMNLEGVETEAGLYGFREGFHDVSSTHFHS